MHAAQAQAQAQAQAAAQFGGHPGMGAPVANTSTFSASRPSFVLDALPASKPSFMIGAAPVGAYPGMQMPAESPVPTCVSYQERGVDRIESYTAQEELNLFPQFSSRGAVPYEVDAASILAAHFGGTMAPGQFEHQFTPSIGQLAAAEAAREAAEAVRAAAEPSPLQSLIASRPDTQKILFMRHGESESNVSRRDIPDPNLTALGQAQAKSWQESVGEFGADLVLVSPLRRACQTACLAFSEEEVPMLMCRFARELGWSAQENTIGSTPKSLRAMLRGLPRGNEIHGIEEGLLPAHDDPPDELSSLQRLRLVLASRPERTIIVVCHFGVIAALTGRRAKNGDVYECMWGEGDQMQVLMRHKTPLADNQCLCG